MFSVKQMSSVMVAAMTAFIAGQTQAATVTYSATVAPRTLFTNEPAGAGFGNDIYATANEFDPALGTLTGVKLALSISFSVTATGGPGGGSLVLTDYISVNNAKVTQGGSLWGNGYAVNTGAPGSATGIDTNFANVDGPYAYYTGSGTYQIDYNPGTSFQGGGQGPVFASASIIAPSSIDVTYTYTPLPEPTALAVTGLAGGAVLLRRRKLV